MRGAEDGVEDVEDGGAESVICRMSRISRSYCIVPTILVFWRNILLRLHHILTMRRRWEDIGVVDGVVERCPC